MDVNYSRWMSKDPDAEPDAVEPEPRRFSMPRPTGAVVASGALAAVVALGGGALVRSIATSDVSGQAQTAESPTAEGSDGPGAAGVEDSTSDDSTYDDSTHDDSTYDDSTYDSAADGTTVYRSAPGDPQLRDRRELRQFDELPPGEPWPDRPPRAHRELAPPPPILRSRP